MSTKNNIPIKPSDEIIEALLEAYTYDPETGEVKHNLNRPRDHFRIEHGYRSWLGTAKKQTVVGSVKNSGYVEIGFTHPLLGKQKIFRAHHIAWLYSKGEWPSNCIDHINGDRADNRIKNLRVVTARQNGHNRANQSVLGVGVTANGNKFQVSIRILDVQYHIGLYNTTDIAGKAFDCVTLSFFDDFSEGSNGLSWCDLDEAIASIPNLAEKIEDIRNKLAEKLEETQQYEETV